MLHKDLDEKLDSYAAGELKHAVEVVSSLWDLSRKKRAFPPLDTTPRPNPCLSRTEDEDRVRISLIKSIQGRPLLYRKYWARQSREGSIGPIYFPSTMPSSALSQVAACECKCALRDCKYTESWTVIECYRSGDGYLERNEEDDFPEDSDYESESELADNLAPGPGKVGCSQQRGQKLLPVLKIGSLAV